MWLWSLMLLVALCRADNDPCPPDTVYHDVLDVCYQFVPVAHTFREAEANCVSLGGELTKSTNGFDNNFISESAKLSMPNVYEMWVGGSWIHDQWMWLDWTPMVYKKWAVGEPRVTSDLMCVSMQTHGGAWMVDSCDVVKSYACTLPSANQPDYTWPTPRPCAESAATVSPCPPNAVYNSDEGVCYYFFNSPSSFADAQRTCVSVGGFLTKIQSFTENVFVYQYAAMDLKGYSELWLGGSWIHRQWMWLDWSNISYTNWASGEPNSSSDVMCVTMQTADGEWRVDNCQVSKPFVCTLPTNIDPNHTWPPPVTSRPCDPTCDAGWTYSNITNFCYQASTLTSTFDQAEASCAAKGAHLSSVHSANEKAILMAFLKSYIFWIGIHYENGLWVNTDGTPVDYGVNPSSPPTNQQSLCVFLNGNFNQYMCSYLMAYICKKSPTY